MTREDVIRQIVQRDVNDLPLVDDVVKQGAAELHSAACEHFGTWDTALQYAGVSVRRIANNKELTPDRVVRKIQRLCMEGYDLSARKNACRDRRLYKAALRYFGRWQKALVAAGVNVEHVHKRRRPRKLDREEIIRKIQERMDAGLSMRCKDVCLENQELATAAMTAFASWCRALHAAGLGPPPPDRARKWDQAKVIAAIQKHHRAGKPCNYDAVRNEVTGLVSAGRRYFGKWRNALEAAGVKPKETHVDPKEG